MLELDGDEAPVEVAVDDVSVAVDDVSVALAEVSTVLVLVLDVTVKKLDGPVDKEGRAGGQTDAGGADQVVARHVRGGHARRGGRNLARREGVISGRSSKAGSEGEDGDELETHFDWVFVRECAGCVGVLFVYVRGGRRVRAEKRV